MTLFTAEHIPMMTSLARGAAAAIKQNEHVTSALAIMANSCMKMIKSKKYVYFCSTHFGRSSKCLVGRFLKAETNLFCARAMTGAIILYDHTHSLGSFHKRTPI